MFEKYRIYSIGVFQEGQDVTELQKRVAELRRQQYALKSSIPRRIPVNRLVFLYKIKSATTIYTYVFIEVLLKIVDSF